MRLWPRSGCSGELCLDLGLSHIYQVSILPLQMILDGSRGKATRGCKLLFPSSREIDMPPEMPAVRPECHVSGRCGSRLP